MPRGYQLNSYYDALRAVFRKLYSTQIKYLSGTIDRCGLRNTDAYKLIVSSLNNGINDGLSEQLYRKTHHGNNPEKYIGHNKSSYEQDFMSPLELRLNAIAVRRAEKQINKIANRGRFTLKDIQDICYTAGREVSSEFTLLKEDDGEFNMHISQPVLSTKPIIKKYDQNLVLGTLPKSKTFVPQTPQEQQEKERLIYINNSTFSNIKSHLIKFGLLSTEQRQMAFAKFNCAYYETDAGNSHTLEISKILITDKAADYVSITELQMNCEKLEFMLSELSKIQGTPAQNVLYTQLKNAGAKARQIIISKHRTLPELYSGFYHTYIDSDKRIVNQKAVKQNAGR